MSNALEYKDYCGTIEYPAADNMLHGKVVGVRGYLSFAGNSLDELRKDFEEMIDEYLADCAEDGVEPQKPFKGSFNVRLSPELHRSLAIYSINNGQSLNATVEEAVKRFVMETTHDYSR